MALLQTAALVGAFAATAYAHGHVTGIVADGTYHLGYDPSFQYQQTPPKVVGWSDPKDLSNGFIAPSAYNTPDIICHLEATPGQAVAKVAAGGKVDLQWTAWPESHHGPVLDYLAKCANDDCTKVEKASLEFFKIGQSGLIDDSAVPGTWASDKLIANNNTWTANIPKDIAPGQYVLRHEIIALHSAGQADGAQNYPQCVNIEVTGSGTATPSGVVGTKLYTSDAPGIVVNIYQSLSYQIPGPTLYAGAASGAQPTAAASSAAASSAAPAATSAPQASSSSAASSSAAALAVTSAAAAPSSANAAVATATETTECTSTVTIKTSVTASAAAVTASPSVYVAPTVPAAAAVSALASAVPTSALTATISTALPSPASYGGSAASGSAAPGAPSKPLPAGFTLKDLLEWVAYLLGKAIKEDSSVHARDFQRR